MNTSLQQLTDKIYQEGVEKGNAQAESIIEAAKIEAEKIIKEAEAKAAKLIEKANVDVAETNRAALSELQMASDKAIVALKQTINDMVGGEIIDNSIKAATADTAFVQSLIENTIKNWASSEDKTFDMNVIVPSKDEKAIVDYFASAAKGLLDKGLTISSANNVKAGFQLVSANGSYKISFTDEDFISFFKEFVRPKVAELLFKA